MFFHRVVVQFKMEHTKCSVTVLLCSLRRDILSVLLPYSCAVKMEHLECSVTVLLCSLQFCT